MQITTFCPFLKQKVETLIYMQKAKHLNVVKERAKKSIGGFRNKYYQNYFAFFKESGCRTPIPEQHVF